MGDGVEVDTSSGPQHLTVTGVAVMPEVGGVDGGPGEGGVMRLAGLAALFPGRQPNLALLDLDQERAAQAVASIRQESSDAHAVSGPFLPTRLYAFERLRGCPSSWRPSRLRGD